MRVCIGGTFDKLHEGHRLLIDTAFEIAGKKGTVFIGITSDQFLADKKNIASLKKRIENLKNYLSKKHFLDRATIKPINDKYGPTIKEDFDVIVVSPETYNTAKEINKKRKKYEKKPLKIVKIPYVLAEDGILISSTRIRNKEINEEGKLLKEGD